VRAEFFSIGAQPGASLYFFLLRRCSAFAAAEFFRRDAWWFPVKFFKFAFQSFPAGEELVVLMTGLPRGAAVLFFHEFVLASAIRRN
jgi:hypothetical protein